MKDSWQRERGLACDNGEGDPLNNYYHDNQWVT